MLNLIKTLHDEFLTKLDAFKQLTPRKSEFVEVKDKISVAIGMRRTGKTHLMFSKMHSLLNNGISSSQILYIDFEDDRLIPLDSEKLAQLVDNFYRLFPNNHDQMCYLFLDEIQVVENWAIVIRRLSKTGNIKLFLSGSSAKLLSKEIATSLRGRSISTEVWPFSFEEFLLARNVKIPKTAISKKELDLLMRELMLYFKTGGFPGLTNETPVVRNKILQEYIDTVIYRDIVERNNITNLKLIKYMILYLLKNYATNFSVNKFYNDVKSQGFSISRATLYNYLIYIEDSYLMFSIPLFSESIRKTQSNPKKIYVIDSGLAQAVSLDLNENKGRFLENLVYLDLRRRGDTIYYYLTKSRYEVDFFTKSLNGSLNLYQVAFDVTDKKTWHREMRALEEAEEELKIKGTLITCENYVQWSLLEMNLNSESPPYA